MEKVIKSNIINFQIDMNISQIIVSLALDDSLSYSRYSCTGNKASLAMPIFVLNNASPINHVLLVSYVDNTNL